MTQTMQPLVQRSNDDDGTFDILLTIPMMTVPMMALNSKTKLTAMEATMVSMMMAGKTKVEMRCGTMTISEKPTTQASNILVSFF